MIDLLGDSSVQTAVDMKLRTVKLTNISKIL